MQKKLPNALRPGRNANNLPPKAIQSLRDLPPPRQERFLQNNQRFQNLPPDQQAKIRQRLEAWNRLTPGQQQTFRDRQRVWEQMTWQRRDVRKPCFRAGSKCSPLRRQAILQRLHSLARPGETDRPAKLDDPAFVERIEPGGPGNAGQLVHLHVGMAPGGPECRLG